MEQSLNPHFEEQEDSSEEEKYSFEKEWQEFSDMEVKKGVRGEDVMDQDEFERRMNIIYETEELNQLTRKELKNDNYWLLLRTDIRKVISPYTVAQEIKNNSICWEEYTNVAYYIVMTLPDDHKLAVSNGQTFIREKRDI